MSGQKSPLSSPLTVPMATSSSGAADGGCLPASSTWPPKPEGRGMPGRGGGRGGQSEEVNCNAARGGAERELTAGIENGPLCSAALQCAPLAIRTHHTNMTLTLCSMDSRSSRQTSLKSLYFS